MNISTARLGHYRIFQIGKKFLALSSHLTNGTPSLDITITRNKDVTAVIMTLSRLHFVLTYFSSLTALLSLTTDKPQKFSQVIMACFPRLKMTSIDLFISKSKTHER